MDSERGYLELSKLYMERRFNIYSNIWKYLQLFEEIEDIFKWMKDIFKWLNKWRYFQIFKYMLKWRSIYNKLNSK